MLSIGYTMNPSVYNFPVYHLLWFLLPLAFVAWNYARWTGHPGILPYATARMFLQLVLIGYALGFIFTEASPGLLLGILSIMLTIAAWIAIRPVRHQGQALYVTALLSLSIGCITTLVLVVVGVVQLTPWHQPRYLIPIAGMIFANAMNSVSLAAERLHTECQRNTPHTEAAAQALQAALLPLVNSFLAVGLVSLPGMMTGQILAGIDPLVAVRYQIMVMGMLLSASGISTVMYLWLQLRRLR